MDEKQRQAIIEKIAELKNLRIFHYMSPKDVFEVMKRCQTRYVKPGEHVVYEGDLDRQLYIIVQGNFEVSSKDKDGDKITFFFAGEGLIFGEMSFLDNEVRSANIIAAEDGELLCLGKDDYDQLLKEEPESAARFMMGVAEMLSRRLRGADRRLKHLS